MFIGAVTFTGSVIAYLKLSAKISSAPLMLPARNALNLAVLVISGGLFVWFLIAPSVWPLLLMTVLALLLGLHLVVAIGGGDMPVVVSMLNSYSGWAAAAAGFMLGNNLLIITGALVSSSGAILSYIMCRAMNRRFLSVILGGFGAGTTEGAAAASVGAAEVGEHRETAADELAELLADAESIVIAPGYGMAVANSSTRSPTSPRNSGRAAEAVPVRRASGGGPAARAHERAARGGPRALRHRVGHGRDPGRLSRHGRGSRHRRQRHGESRRRGRPRRRRSPACPSSKVWKADHVIVFKRSMATGYAVQNPLFFAQNTQMLFGDAKDQVEKVAEALGAKGGAVPPRVEATATR